MYVHICIYIYMYVAVRSLRDSRRGARRAQVRRRVSAAQQMLVYGSENRIRAADAMRHPYFADLTGNGTHDAGLGERRARLASSERASPPPLLLLAA